MGRCQAVGPLSSPGVHMQVLGFREGRLIGPTDRNLVILVRSWPTCQKGRLCSGSSVNQPLWSVD